MSEKTLHLVMAQRDALEAERDRYKAAIERAIADSESGKGWGPDVTVCEYLRAALNPKTETKP